jgi:hypothetical protein
MGLRKEVIRIQGGLVISPKRESIGGKMGEPEATKGMGMGTGGGEGVSQKARYVFPSSVVVERAGGRVVSGFDAEKVRAPSGQTDGMSVSQIRDIRGPDKTLYV